MSCPSPQAAAASDREIIALPSYPLSNEPSEIQRVANLMLQYNMLSQNFNVSQMLH